MDTPIKKLTEIKRPEWIYYNWTDVTANGDSERTLLRGLPRLPNEAYRAALEFDTWLEASILINKISISEHLKAG